MPLIMKTKLAVFAIGLLAMQITDSARGSGTRGGATGLLINGDASALVSSDMAVVPSYIPLDPLRPYAARAGQNGTGGAQPMNNGLPGPDPNIFRYADFEKLRATGHAGAYLSGNVSVAGGNLPWAPIQITVMCKGKTSFTTTADPKGGFVIAEQQRFDSTQIIGKEQSFIGQFIGCTVTAALPGFESSQLTIAPRDVREGPMIGSIKLTPEEGSTGSV